MIVHPLSASAAAVQYLSDVVISYGTTDQEAKNWLTQNGYKIVNQNLNQGGEGGSDALSWLGLKSEKRSVYLGYKTTTNANETITNMKVMNMNGGYSYQAYEKVLEEIKAEKEHFLSNIMTALTEYRENYNAGRAKAMVAYENLNKFKDDDTGQLMGGSAPEYAENRGRGGMKGESEAARRYGDHSHAGQFHGSFRNHAEPCLFSRYGTGQLCAADTRCTK